MARLVDDVGRREEGLRRDTPVVETGAARFIRVDERHGQPELCRTDRRDVTAGTGADDEYVSLRR